MLILPVLFLAIVPALTEAAEPMAPPEKALVDGCFYDNEFDSNGAI